MKNNVYHGFLDCSRRYVTVNGQTLLYTSDQPNWGYVGSGPAKVAEAIMVNEYGPQVDRGLINRFLEEVVAHWLREDWALSSVDIEQWYDEVIMAD